MGKVVDITEQSHIASKKKSCIVRRKCKDLFGKITNPKRFN